MKKIIFLFALAMPFFLLGETKIVTNYNSSCYEIYKDSRLIKSFPFERFCNYQQVSNSVYFIDTINSKIPEYGKLCHYDISENKLIYLPIMTGSSFFISDKTIIVTTLLESNSLNEIENVFKLEDYSDYKAYPLNISLYDLETENLIKTFDFSVYFSDIPYEYIYVNIIKTEETDIVKFYYGIYDSSHILLKGQINLNNLETHILEVN